ncbi:MAG: yhaT [Paenibacillus sp.]|nr:yhaT [Paenibacillus sp.]
MKLIRESDLPGIGRKYEVETLSRERLVIVVHDDGRREIFTPDRDDPDENMLVFTLEDDEARAIGAIIGGMNYKPKALETIEVVLNDLIIEWYRIGAEYPCVGKTIGELGVRQRTGANIIAAVYPDESHHINPGPDYRLKGGSTLIVAGERNQIKVLKQLLTHGGH